MRATSALISAATFALSFAGCESIFIYPANEYISPEAFRFLSPADIREIERLAIAVVPRKDLHSIHATSSDQASVECGDPYVQNAQMTAFAARRKDGRWIVDRSSISTFQPVIVE
jgi:hypothetical protein